MGCGVYYNIICSLCVPFLQVCMHACVHACVCSLCQRDRPPRRCECVSVKCLKCFEG